MSTGTESGIWASIQAHCVQVRRVSADGVEKLGDWVPAPELSPDALEALFADKDGSDAPAQVAEKEPRKPEEPRKSEEGNIGQWTSVRVVNTHEAWPRSSPVPEYCVLPVSPVWCGTGRGMSQSVGLVAAGEEDQRGQGQGDADKAQAQKVL